MNGFKDLTACNGLDEDEAAFLSNEAELFATVSNSFHTNESVLSANNSISHEGSTGDEAYEEKDNVPTPAEAFQMFHGLKRFLSKYTPDSNDLIFDLEKKVNQGIENNRKITKFSLS